eukprot:Mrub_00795.p1 GENE.Mrub_00795~~Mrub_00795.p1  ORF type:complete len:855 (+),score=154.56 Mrub_00795:56-2566(+)
MLQDKLYSSAIVLIIGLFTLLSSYVYEYNYNYRLINPVYLSISAMIITMTSCVGLWYLIKIDSQLKVKNNSNGLTQFTNLQIAMTVILQIVILYDILNELFFPDETHFYVKMTKYVIIYPLVLNLFISSYIQLYFGVTIELVLIAIAWSVPDSDFLVYCYCHAFYIAMVFCKIISTFVMYQILKQTTERVKLYAEYMHDVRNYVYGLSESIVNMDTANLVRAGDDTGEIDDTGYNADTENSEGNLQRSEEHDYKLRTKLVDVSHEKYSMNASTNYSNDDKSLKSHSNYSDSNYNPSNNHALNSNQQPKVKNYFESKYYTKQTTKDLVYKKDSKDSTKYSKLAKIDKNDYVDYLINDFEFENDSIIYNEDDYYKENLDTHEIDVSNSFNQSEQDQLEQFREMKKKYYKQTTEYDIEYLMKNCNSTKDILNILRFVNYKICFLYHIDLTFDQIYKIKLVQTQPQAILDNIASMMKILFVNKNNIVKFNVVSKLSIVNIDVYMLKYFVCFLSLTLHKNNYYDYLFKVEFGKKMVNDYEYENLKFRIKTNNANLSPIYMDGCAIFVNIIINLGHDVSYKYKMLEDGHYVDIIYNGTKYLTKKDNDQTDFDKTEVIKDSKIEHLRQAEISSEYNSNKYITSNSNSYINSNSNQENIKKGSVILHETNLDELKCETINSTKYAFVNLDDEYNILSMNKQIMSKQNLSLNCFYHPNDLLGVIAQTGTRYMLDNSDCPQFVILLDHQLDCVTGLEVLHQVKELQRKFNLSILWVLLSSTEDQNTVSRYEEKGVRLHIAKPFSKGKLNEVLNYLGHDQGGLGNNACDNGDPTITVKTMDNVEQEF